MRLCGISPSASTAAFTCSSGEAKLLPMAIYARVMLSLHDAARVCADDEVRITREGAQPTPSFASDTGALRECGECTSRGGAHASVVILQRPSEARDRLARGTEAIELRRAGPELPDRSITPWSPELSQRSTTQRRLGERATKGEGRVAAPDIRPFRAGRVQREMRERRRCNTKVRVTVA